jgi:hypothetical protein
VGKGPPGNGLAPRGAALAEVAVGDGLLQPDPDKDLGRHDTVAQVSFLPSSRLRAMNLIGTSRGGPRGQHQRGELVLRPNRFSVTGSSRNKAVGSSFGQVCKSLIQVLNNAFAVKVFARLPMANQNERAVDAPNLRTRYTPQRRRARRMQAGPGCHRPSTSGRYRR